MTTIVLCGQREETGTRRMLLRALSAYGGVQSYDGRRLQKSGDDPAFFLYESPHIPITERMDGILVFKNLFYLQEKERAQAGFLPVLDARNMAAAAALKGSGAIAITCGASPRDTFSMASLRDDSAVVSLQRDLTDLSGQSIEPHDITLRLRGRAELYPLLASCAVLLLAGIPSQNGYCF